MKPDMHNKEWPRNGRFIGTIDDIDKKETWADTPGYVGYMHNSFRIYADEVRLAKFRILQIQIAHNLKNAINLK